MYCGSEYLLKTFWRCAHQNISQKIFILAIHWCIDVLIEDVLIKTNIRILNNWRFFHQDNLTLRNVRHQPANIYLLKVNNRNTRKRTWTMSKVNNNITRMTSWCRSGVFIFRFEYISHLPLLFLLVLWTSKFELGSFLSPQGLSSKNPKNIHFQKN